MLLQVVFVRVSNQDYNSSSELTNSNSIIFSVGVLAFPDDVWSSSVFFLFVRGSWCLASADKSILMVVDGLNRNR